MHFRRAESILKAVAEPARVLSFPVHYVSPFSDSIIVSEKHTLLRKEQTADSPTLLPRRRFRQPCVEPRPRIMAARLYRFKMLNYLQVC